MIARLMNGVAYLAYIGCGAVSLVVIAMALRLWGAAEVRSEPGEILLLTVFGAIWLVAANGLFGWMGISYKDDAQARRNDAALIAVCGGLLGVAIIYAGGSAGEGPSYLNNLFSAGLGTAGLFLLWFVLELGGGVSVSVAEERDIGSGMRLGGFLLGESLILGRAVAGNWHSASATLDDFVRDGWAAVVLLAIALVVERFARPGRACPFPNWQVCGLAPGLMYLAIAAGWIWYIGRWEGMPR